MLLIGENPTRTCPGMTPRGLLQAGLLSAAGLPLPDLLHLRAAAAERAAPAVRSGTPHSALRTPHSVILLWLWGGPSHLDTFDPKPEAPSEYRGPYRVIPTS